MADSSESVNRMWRRWQEEPPQIPDAPIAIWRFGWPEAPVTTRAELILPEASVTGLMWKPLGLYREEVWKVTGKWI